MLSLNTFICHCALLMLLSGSIQNKNTNSILTGFKSRVFSTGSCARSWGTSQAAPPRVIKWWSSYTSTLWVSPSLRRRWGLPGSTTSECIYILHVFAFSISRCIFVFILLTVEQSRGCFINWWLLLFSNMLNIHHVFETSAHASLITSCFNQSLKSVCKLLIEQGSSYGHVICYRSQQCVSYGHRGNEARWALAGTMSLFSTHTLPPFPKRPQERLPFTMLSPTESILGPSAPLRTVDQASWFVLKKLPSTATDRKREGTISLEALMALRFLLLVTRFCLSAT